MTPPDAVLDGDTGTARFVEQRTVDPADLVPYPGNPNVGDVDEIRVSLRANGQYRTPVTRLMPDGRLTVLAGHATRLAAIAEGLPLRVDVIEVDDKTARRIVAADNRTAQLAHYDETLLLDLLEAADKDGGLAGTGWDEDAYGDLMARAGAPPTLDDLERKHGEPGERDLWPVIKLAVPPETRDQLAVLLTSPKFEDWQEEHERFAALLSLAEQGMSLS